MKTEDSTRERVVELKKRWRFLAGYYERMGDRKEAERMRHMVYAATLILDKF